MVLAVIPARYASARLPGKPLVDIGGQTLIQRVYAAVVKCESLDQVVVATDDERIFRHVEDFGGAVVMTAATHPSGTDRVAEAARNFPEASIVVNVQGDEPFIQPEQIAAVVDPFRDEKLSICTLATPMRDEHALLSPNVVKVVRDEAGRALYFSRHAIPFLREVPIGRWIDQQKHLQHIGLYAYRAEVLQQLTVLPTAPLELDESLEQLRWLSAGYRIYVGLTDLPSIGVDTPADLEEAIRRVTD
ncbi:3-deoxy-manno-octulosonate cytidylyltransferase (CMP-KDO synthetase) [Lewinella aquimaris]|uniref:3-deoxy-manno-octulosonate cytidylyltransferase n=1 Tax=Neolewinella aquimaris TaxID=1835722 RepID=A0A840DYC4_9BACT|nr:3-deoxy-manno-octulosonate cytidylyltransferase [Neolewinella aquimaris]MBB4077920.1 3-deoxy-manno-octulosonate cytidylyltransferase (CMP-KDO synthetase) [Neolewinella aquimaris]